MSPATSVEGWSASGAVRIELAERWRYTLREGRSHGTSSRDNDENPAQSAACLKQVRELAQDKGAALDSSHAHETVLPPPPGSSSVGLPGLTEAGTDTVTIAFSATATAIAFLRTIRPVIIQWLKNLGDRSVTISHGETTVRIEGSSDIDQALQLLEEVVKTERLPHSASNEEPE